MPEPSISVTPIPNTELKKITLKNDELTVVLLNYGARLHQIFAPDNKGHLENVLLSYDELSDVLIDQFDMFFRNLFFTFRNKLKMSLNSFLLYNLFLFNRGLLLNNV